MTDLRQAAPQAAPVAVPKGWKLVPVEPTHKMIRWGEDYLVNHTVELIAPATEQAERVYLEMLAAAPETPTQSVSDDVVRDAERWRVSNMIHEAGWKHSTRQTKAESVARSVYQEAVSKGLNHEAATDAAIAAMKGADHE